MGPQNSASSVKSAPSRACNSRTPFLAHLPQWICVGPQQAVQGDCSRTRNAESERWSRSTAMDAVASTLQYWAPPCPREEDPHTLVTHACLRLRVRKAPPVSGVPREQHEESPTLAKNSSLFPALSHRGPSALTSFSLKEISPKQTICKSRWWFSKSAGS